MSLRYRSFTRDVAYICPALEAALLTRTSQRSVGLSRAKAAHGVPYVVAMYGVLPRTPEADNLLTGVAWFGRAAQGMPTWLMQTLQAAHG
jgi:hypothetical protein